MIRIDIFLTYAGYVKYLSHGNELCGINYMTPPGIFDLLTRF